MGDNGVAGGAAGASRRSNAPSAAGSFQVNGLSDPDVKSKMQDLFGRVLTANQLAATIGAQPGMKIGVSGGQNSLRVVVSQNDWKDPVSGKTGSVRLDRAFQRDDNGKLYSYNSYFSAGEGLRGSGLGFRVFSSQVQGLRRNGFDRIELQAAGSKGGGMNGYITWAKFGYNARLSSSYNLRGVAERAVAAGIRAKDGSAPKFMSDLMATAKGRTWWDQNGSSWDGVFTLAPNSTSMRVLNAYKRRSAKKRG